ncbi:MAG: folylpolyglutamate synthase/dihydrofolate synthase family protein [Candidatus Thioglobus sp.]|jgi:dihydrofolate synthase/folylpolyglutamate synthase|nr:folylpolyglutamate synthase/dihydrofolate synthase family protein [Candidatus Thioglobus sp.]|tara:strand:- start:1119 stop:2315 length:1197 start_codon:yes stop_codon:yes gene_type:complete
MQNRDSLDEWLRWQENLMEETILLGLERVQKVYQRLFPNGVPFFVVTVGGTNGKGSTISFIEGIYRDSEYKIGCSTSPHLIKYNERYAIDGKIVDDATIVRAFEAIERKREGISLTYFEFSTLAALLIFAEASIDIAILEVGLGGRLDSVNVVDCDIAVITNIDIDHTDYLGNTRESIGLEKAGIMRKNKSCFCADQDPPKSLLAYADEIGANLAFVREPYGGEIGLKGDHQKINAALAIKVVEQLNGQFPVSSEMIKAGARKAQIAARFQQIESGNKTVILDVAHNSAAVKTLVKMLEKNAMPTVAIFSALADKDIDDMIRLASKTIMHWFLVPISSERALQTDDLKNIFDSSQATTVCSDMKSAINQALLHNNSSRVVIFGSFYTVTDAMVILQDN